QVLAAIDWVVQHRNDNGMNIRVLNLSFGTDGIQDYRLDPLTYAAEVAWRKGIVVVVAAGNSQFGSPELNNPAYDPYVLAVGAADTKGTYDPSDDVVPGWSARGDGTRGPDLVAPGRSVVSLRNPGSQIDVAHPSARVGERFFKGTGTSQSAAVVSGAAALVVSQRPEISPDGVKALLTSTARPLSGSDPEAQGAGVVDLKAAYRSPTPETVQSWPLAEGTGSLDAARGTGRVVGPDGVELSGEVDIFGTPWDGVSWSGASWNGVSWSGASWNGVTWSGASWNGVSWSGASWSGVTWSGASWSGVTWSGASWSGVSWSGASWSGVSWSGVSWSAAGWGE
ncbi:MAG TPA: S8 family serine peptidase, partial [Actinomycetota bacterium]|nr:S8 family serine peptidase [Actinomycetota bacterium]